VIDLSAQGSSSLTGRQRRFALPPHPGDQGVACENLYQGSQPVRETKAFPAARETSNVLKRQLVVCGFCLVHLNSMPCTLNPKKLSSERWGWIGGAERTGASLCSCAARGRGCCVCATRSQGGHAGYRQGSNHHQTRGVDPAFVVCYGVASVITERVGGSHTIPSSHRVSPPESIRFFRL